MVIVVVTTVVASSEGQDLFVTVFFNIFRKAANMLKENSSNLIGNVDSSLGSMESRTSAIADLLASLHLDGVPLFIGFLLSC
jgi:hypothetical protein